MRHYLQASSEQTHGHPAQPQPDGASHVEVEFDVMPRSAMTPMVMGKELGPTAGLVVKLDSADQAGMVGSPHR